MIVIFYYYLSASVKGSRWIETNQWEMKRDHGGTGETELRSRSKGSRKQFTRKSPLDLSIHRLFLAEVSLDRRWIFCIIANVIYTTRRLRYRYLISQIFKIPDEIQSSLRYKINAEFLCSYKAVIFVEMQIQVRVMRQEFLRANKQSALS